MFIPRTNSAAHYQAYRRQLGRLISLLSLLAYALMTGLYIYRVLVGFSLIRAVALAILLAELIANAAVLAWLWQGRLNLAGWGYLVVNAAGMGIFVFNSSTNSAFIGVVVALALSVDAAAVLPRHRVARGIFFGYNSGALIAALGYFFPGRPTYLDPANSAVPVLVGVIVVFTLLIARLYAGFTLQAKLLLASGSITWLAVVGLFIPVYWLTHVGSGVSAPAAAAIESAMVITGAAGVMVSSFVSQVAARFILRPLHIVATASERVAVGDLSALGQPAAAGITFDQQLRQLEQQSQDEIGDLVRAFNGMTARLSKTMAGWEQKVAELQQAERLIQAQYEQLTAQHEELQTQTEELHTQERALAKAEAELRQLNTDLERRVAARTAELADANSQLAATNSQMRTLNQELESFSHSVSHDLRAPLRNVSGYARMLAEDYSPQLDLAARRALERIQAGTAHMGALIEGLLQLARLTRADLHRTPVDLSALANVILHDLHVAEPARQVEFICTPGLVVAADANLMRAVLENLLGNAWKFTAQHPTARIEMGQAFQQGQCVYFVRDDGAGFDMDFSSRLFGAFQRLHSDKEFEGTGIGLASAQRILHRHGGRIWAEGAVEQGATFYFTLPANTSLLPAAQDETSGAAGQLG